MFSPDQYELIDFGEGRKLERFGAVLLDRPSPAAEGCERSFPAAWGKANASYHRTYADRGEWRTKGPAAKSWAVAHQKMRLELKLTEFGHLGVFPEQAANWDWIAAQPRSPARPLQVLNLFAYTGGSTLAAAAAGSQVVHVDAAQNVVNWARRNAELSGLAEAPVRWIAEDAVRFVRREIKRGSDYQAVILDPPAYGHGPGGEVWQLGDGLPELLAGCAQLLADDPRYLLLSCHSRELAGVQLKELVAEAMRDHAGRVEVQDLYLLTARGRRLPSGVAVRWMRGS